MQSSNLKKLSFLLISFFAAVCLSVSGAPVTNDGPPVRLRVCTKQTESLVFDKAGKLEGYSIGLWMRMAELAGPEYEFTTVQTLPLLLGAIPTGDADVVGAISITAERNKEIDVSVPVYRSGLKILTGNQGGVGFGGMVWGFLKSEALKMLGILFLALFLFGNIVWLRQRGENSENIPAFYPRGILEAMWFSLLTLVGGADAHVLGWSGRTLKVVWAFVGMAVFSCVTATIASTMTVNTLTSDIKDSNDLRSRTVGTVAGSTAEAFLQQNGIATVSFAKIGEGIDALQGDMVAAVFYDAPILDDQLTLRGEEGLQLVPHLIQKQHYGFALQKASPYRQAINHAMLTLDEQGFFDELHKNWFGAEGG